MKRLEIYQIEMHVDLDGPIVYVHRWWRKGRSRYGTHYYRCRDIGNPAVKARFIKRAAALQMALCGTGAYQED